MPNRKHPCSASNYDEATVHLLSAFCCLTGKTEDDECMRQAIETLLVNLNRMEIAAAPSNIVNFCRRGMRTDN